MNGQWLQWNLYYYEDQKDDLILRLVQPLHHEFLEKGWVDGFYFLRHWLGGPHLRLRFQVSDLGVFQANAVPRMKSEVERYLQDHPSKKKLTDEQYRPIHQMLSDVEKEPAEYELLHPDNTLEEAIISDRSSVLGSMEAVQLLYEFYEKSTKFVYDVLTASDGQFGNRLGIAFEMLVTTGEVGYKKGIELAFLSYRSHANAFMISVEQPALIANMFRTTYAERQETLDKRLVQLIADLKNETGDIGVMQQWRELIIYFKEKIMNLLGRGVVILGETTELYGRNYEDIFSGQLDLSQMHVAIGTAKRLQNFMSSSVDFLTLRVILNYMYLTLGRLGLRPLERFVICNLVASSVENVYGLDAQQIIREQEEKLGRGGWESEWKRV